MCVRGLREIVIRKALTNAHAESRRRKHRETAYVYVPNLGLRQCYWMKWTWYLGNVTKSVCPLMRSYLQKGICICSQIKVMRYISVLALASSSLAPIGADISIPQAEAVPSIEDLGRWKLPVVVLWRRLMCNYCDSTHSSLKYQHNAVRVSC